MTDDSVGRRLGATAFVEPAVQGRDGKAPGNALPAFTDGKAADAFRTIGEVAQALDIRPHVLRYWEDQFPMLRPVKRSGGRRYYRREDVELVQTIDRLVHHEGYTLRGARQFLEQQGKAGAARDAGAGHAPSRKPAGERAPAIGETAPPDGLTQNLAITPDVVARLRDLRSALARALD